MKKIISLAVLILGIGYCSFAQDEDENSNYGKQLKLIEQKVAKSKSDEEAISFIKATKSAKNSRDEYVKIAPGYGKAAVSADELKKFRNQLNKSDAKYQELNKTLQEKKTAKREYFSTIDPAYKEIYAKLLAEQAVNTKGKKK